MAAAMDPYNSFTAEQNPSTSNSWLTGTVAELRPFKEDGFIKPDVSLGHQFTGFTLHRRSQPSSHLGHVHFYKNRAPGDLRTGERVQFKLKTNNAQIGRPKLGPAAYIVSRIMESQNDSTSTKRKQSGHTMKELPGSSIGNLFAPSVGDGEISSVAPDRTVYDLNESSSSDSDSNTAETQEAETQRADRDEVNVSINTGSHVNDQLTGHIVTIKETFGFIRIDEKKNIQQMDQLSQTMVQRNSDGHSKQIYFNFQQVHSGNFPLSVGDLVSFSRRQGRQNQNEKEFAQNVHLLKCKSNSRSAQDIEAYLGSVVKDAKTLIGMNDVIVSITCLPVWKYLGDCQSLSVDATAMLIDLLIKLNKRESLREIFTSLLDTLLGTRSLLSADGPFAQHIKLVSDKGEIDELQDVYQLLLTSIRLVPRRSRQIVDLLKHVVSDDKSKVDNFLLRLVRQLLRGLSDGGAVEDLMWNEMPLVPSVDELTTGLLRDSIAGLRPVRVSGKYDSAEDYLDTYFRLLRADCITAISKGVKDLLQGQLDHRDMNVYGNIRFVGVHVEDGGAMSLALEMKSGRNETQPLSRLIFGNLLCISISGTFRDPIWATVSSSELSKRGIAIIELCSESNSLSDSDAIVALHFAGPSSVVVESPTYYRAYQPVLKSLQTMDPESLAFKSELVNCECGSSPNTILSSSTFKSSIVNYVCSTGDEINVQKYCAEEWKENVSTLDSSQETAVKQTLRNRISIVQGPPGTGKTHIGVKIVEILRSLSNEPSTPIVVLTYKNHALDEFLKFVLKLFPGKVARLGGRSQDPDIQSCCLPELRRSLKMPQPMYNQLKEFQAELEILKGQVKESVESLHARKYFTTDMFLEALSSEQLAEFLKGCDWKRCKMKSMKNILPQSPEDFIEVNKYVTSRDVECILKECNDSDVCNVIRNRRSGDSLGNNLYKLLQTALQAWLPSNEIFREFELDQGGFNDWKSSSNIRARSSTNGAQNSEDNEIDLDELKRERLAAIMSNTGSKGGQEILKEMIIFDELKAPSDVIVPTGSHQRKQNPCQLLSTAKEIFNKIPIGVILGGLDNPWNLHPSDRIKLVQCLMYRKFVEESKKFEDIFRKYQRRSRAKEEIEDHRKVSILASMKIVGMTVTGANIHHKMMSELRPEIILVEEAAEVLEPQLLAVIGSWAKHLIMIGDHLQLRPSVESHELAKKFNMDVSMMERLINNSLPYSTLAMQNRMREEFAGLLLDIYPDLRSNTARIKDNAAANCVAKSMYFWHHEDPEQSERSYSNHGEGRRAVRLALFLILQGYSPKSITILSPYLGQVRLLRKLMKEAEQEHPELFGRDDIDVHTDAVASSPPAQTASSDGNSPTLTSSGVKIHTVDMYQGDENDFVIVSLTRSNSKGEVGFVDSLNRRCVAQSRSRRGLYFIGNRFTLTAGRGNKTWAPLLQCMEEADCVGTRIPLHCPTHPELSKIFPIDADEIPLKNEFCKEICCEIMSCKIHHCTRRCQPKHDHRRCEVKVQFEFDVCGHNAVRECYEPVETLRCSCKINVYKLPNCNHSGVRECWQDVKDIKCERRCTRVLANCGHPCEKLCWEPCDPNECGSCQMIREAEAKKQKELEECRRKVKCEQIENKIKEIEAQNPQQICSRLDLSKEGDTAAEYYNMEDRVMKYIQPGHHWYPKVVRIEKIVNIELEIRWLKRQSKLFDPNHHELKFHGTNKQAMDSIASGGFKLPPKSSRNLMYGHGIYFASDSSKSAQEMYTKGSNMLLVCDVLLGRPKTVHQAVKNINPKTLRDDGFDSVFAKRGTRETGGVLHDEFVVFDVDQALPRYVVHYECQDVHDDVTDHVTGVLNDTTPENRMANPTRRRLVRRLEASSSSYDDVMDDRFRFAECHFSKAPNHSEFTIDSVDYIQNRSRSERFSSVRDSLMEKYADDNVDGGNCIVAFSSESTSNTLNQLLSEDSEPHDSDNKSLEFHFHDIPDSLSIPEGQEFAQLVLCKILLGRAYESPQTLTVEELRDGYDSHSWPAASTSGDLNKNGHEFVVFKIDQILPLYIINFKKNRPNIEN